MGRALMANPGVLMLDEPLTGLDPIFQQRVCEALVEIRTRGHVVVLVEQNVQRSLAIADAALVLDDGRITLSGAAADLAGDPELQERYLGIATGGARQADQRGEPVKP
jgi:branched-chain amino acid transport system ATP-binding protein